MGHLSVIGSRVIRSRSRVVDWCRFVVDGSRLINWCWVVWGRLVNRFWWMVRGRSWVVWSRFGGRLVSRGSRWVIRSNFTFVFHIGNVSVFVISSVSNDLGSAIRKGNTVFTMDNTVIILGFLFGKVSTRVFVFDTIFIGEGPGGQFIFGGWVVRGGLVNGFWWVVRSRGWVVRGWSWVIRSRVVRGRVISHSHSHDRSQQHFAQHDYFFSKLKLNK